MSTLTATPASTQTGKATVDEVVAALAEQVAFLTTLTTNLSTAVALLNERVAAAEKRHYSSQRCRW